MKILTHTQMMNRRSRADAAAELWMKIVLVFIRTDKAEIWEKHDSLWVLADVH
jgi:hypothetical protein